MSRFVITYRECKTRELKNALGSLLVVSLMTATCIVIGVILWAVA